MADPVRVADPVRWGRAAAQAGAGETLTKWRDWTAGAASSDIVFKLSPWIVAAFGLGGIAFALWARKYNPEKYDIIGRVVLDDTHER